MRKIYALLITIAVFIPLTFAAMLLAAVRPWALDRGFYAELLDDSSLEVVRDYDAVLKQLEVLRIDDYQIVIDFGIILIIVWAVAAGMVAGYLGSDDLRGRLRWFSSALFFPASLLLLVGVVLVLPAVEAPLRASIESSNWVAPGYMGAAREAINDLLFVVIWRLGAGLTAAGGFGFVAACLVVLLSMATPHAERVDRKIAQLPVQHT